MIAWEATASGYFTGLGDEEGRIFRGSKYALVLLSHTPTANGVFICYLRTFPDVVLPVADLIG